MKCLAIGINYEHNSILSVQFDCDNEKKLEETASDVLSQISEDIEIKCDEIIVVSVDEKGYPTIVDCSI